MECSTTRNAAWIMFGSLMGGVKNRRAMAQPLPSRELRNCTRRLLKPQFNDQIGCADKKLDSCGPCCHCLKSNLVNCSESIAQRSFAGKRLEQRRCRE